MIKRELKVFFICARNSYKYYSTVREARILQKLIDRGKSKSKMHIPRPTSKSRYAIDTLYSATPRRNTVLNKVLMDHISDSAGNGVYAEKLNEHGISITNCKITKNLKVIFVYWIHTKEINEEEVDELLINYATYLRSEITSFSVINTPPVVRFVKDSKFLEERQLSLLFETISSFNDQKGTDKNIAAENDIVLPKIKSSTSSMQNNVLGLDYCKILKNVVETKTECEGKETFKIPRENEKEKSNFDKKKLANTIFRNNYNRDKLQEIENIPEDQYLYHYDDGTIKEFDIDDYSVIEDSSLETSEEIENNNKNCD